MNSASPGARRDRPVLRTSRLELRPMTTEHLPLLRALDGDPEVLRFILGRARTTQEVDAFWGPRCADLAADAVGLGWWVGFSPSGAFIGWWDASPDEPVPSRPDRAELGWRLARAHWGQGLATEGARAIIEHAFTATPVTTLWAETMAVNLASRRVMEHLGMRHTRTDHRTWERPLPGADHGEVVYEVNRAEWAAAHPAAD